MGIISDVGNMIGIDKYVSEEKDKSNLFAELKRTNNGFQYYAGFGWKESGQFKSKEEWNNYLEYFAKSLKSPLQISIIEQNKEL